MTYQVLITCYNLFPPLLTQNRPSERIFVAKRLFLVYFGPCKATFGTFWVLQIAQTGLSGCPHWYSNLVQPLSTQNRHLWANLCAEKDIFSLFWPIFGHRRATFGTFLVLKMAQTGLSGCLYWYYNLVPPLPA